MENKYQSCCCNADVYCVGGKFRISMNDKIGYEYLPPGKTYITECGKCKKECDYKVSQ